MDAEVPLARVFYFGLCGSVDMSGSLQPTTEQWRSILETLEKKVDEAKETVGNWNFPDPLVHPRVSAILHKFSIAVVGRKSVLLGNIIVTYDFLWRMASTSDKANVLFRTLEYYLHRIHRTPLTPLIAAKKAMAEVPREDRLRVVFKLSLGRNTTMWKTLYAMAPGASVSDRQTLFTGMVADCASGLYSDDDAFLEEMRKRARIMCKCHVRKEAGDVVDDLEYAMDSRSV